MQLLCNKKLLFCVCVCPAEEVFSVKKVHNLLNKIVLLRPGD